jgi:rod shape-determining protein MreC
MGSVVKVARGDYGLFQSVEMEPAVDFSRLEEVLILTEESQ